MPEPSRRVLLDAAEVDRRLAALPGWQRDGDAIRTRYDAPDVPTAIAIVTRMFELAEERDHHPDVDIRWRRLHVLLTTHDAGGITALDLDLATQIEALADAAGASHLPL